jgi:multiple sugar transport system substrate-binding protein/sn-glycerol 3-phosphate transport system substrate-binding protein
MLKPKFIVLIAIFALVLAACANTAELEQAVQQAEAQAANVQATAEAMAADAGIDVEAAKATAEAAVMQAQELAQEAAQSEEAQAALAAAQEQLAQAQAAAEEASARAVAAEEAAAMVEVNYDTEVYGKIDEVDLTGANVVFWHQHSGGREEELMAIVDEFNATNEWGITVEARNEGGYGDIYDKMIAGLTTGELPGLVVAYQNQAAAYEVADGLVSLEPYINNATYGLSEEELADFFKSFIVSDELPQFGGKAYGFPPNRSMELMYFNADWLAELRAAGAVSFDGAPKDPDQFAEAVCAAKNNPFSKNADPSTSVGYEVRTDASNVASMAFATGGDIYDYENNKFTYAQKGLADYMTMMANLLADGCASEIAENFGDQTDFGNGKVLFTMGSSSGLPFYGSAVADGEAGGFAWSVAAVPYTTPNPVMNVYGASVSIPKTDPQTQLAAWLFVRFYTSADIQARWARASNYFPVRESVANGLTDYFAENPAYQTSFELLRYTKTEPGVAGYDPIRDAAQEAFIRVLNGEDANTVLADLDATANQLLAESAP